jgi:hypothetical protein
MKTFTQRLSRAALFCTVLAGTATAALAVPTPPATQQVWRSVESPYDPGAVFHTDSVAFNQFTTVASLTYGFTVGAMLLNGVASGSFQGLASGLTVPVGNSGPNATLTSNATMFARVQQGSDPIAFVDLPGTAKYVHVASLGQPSADSTMLTVSFSSPVYGISFIGAGISDYAGTGVDGSLLSQRVRLDGGAPIDLVSVNPNTISNPMQMSFGALSPTPFSSFELILPAGSLNDNAALLGLRVAFDPALVSAVPEPEGWVLALAGMAVAVALKRRG